MIWFAVVAFNHWANDVSKGIASIIQTRCDIAGEPVPEHIRDFGESFALEDAAVSTPIDLTNHWGCRRVQTKRSMGANSAEMSNGRFWRTKRRPYHEAQKNRYRCQSKFQLSHAMAQN